MAPKKDRPSTVGGATALFSVSGGSTLSLPNLVLQQGGANSGRAIISGLTFPSYENTINITDCLFLENHALDVGGEICNDSASRTCIKLDSMRVRARN